MTAAAPANTANEPVEVVDDQGAVLRVRFPVLAIEGMDTGDGRYIAPGGLGCRALPTSCAGATCVGCPS